MEGGQGDGWKSKRWKEGQTDGSKKIWKDKDMEGQRCRRKDKEMEGRTQKELKPKRCVALQRDASKDNKIDRRTEI